MKSMKVWKKICLACLSIGCLLVIIIALFYVIENVSGRKVWERYVQECEAKNQTAASDKEMIYLWIENILPPSVDEEKNFANHPLFKTAFHFAEKGNTLKEEEGNLEEPLKTWAKVSWDGINLWNGWVGKPSSIDFKRMNLRKRYLSSDSDELKTFLDKIKSGQFNKEEFQNILKELRDQIELEENAPISEEVNALLLLNELEPGLAGYEEMQRALKEYSQCRYPFQYEKGLMASFLPLSDIKGITCYAVLRALTDLILKKSSDEAFQDIMFSLDIADTLHKELSITPFLVKTAIYNNAVNVIWEGIESDYWSLENLKQFQERLAKVDFLDESRISLIGEKCLFNSTFIKGKNDPFAFTDILTDLPKEDGIPQFDIPLTGWVYRAIFECNRRADLALSLFDMENKCYDMSVFPSVLQLDEPQEYVVDSKSKISIRTRFIEYFYGLTPRYSRIINKTAGSQFLINSVQIACALECYRLENKRYPDSLEELGNLLPEDKIPLDWMDHKAPKYRLTDTGYVLWNNGWNRTDEGGVRGKSNEEGDWVWEITHASASNGK